MTTLNGWPEVSEHAVTRIVVGGDKNGATVLDGDVSRAFRWLLEQFHARVEPITEVNGWRSVAFNKQIGGAARSNHTSGTAVDVNGGRHPFEAHHPGKRYSSGFTTAQERAIRAILREAGGLFRWGLDFPVGRRDAMHFELANGTTRADVAAFVARITEQQEDDMPTADEIARAVWGYKAPGTETANIDAHAHLRRINGNAQAAAQAVDVKKLAAALAGELPAGTGLSAAQTQKACEAAIRKTLGSLDS
ncbi:MAG: M15 family metallopeptidase [Cellulomonas sp.]|nr:M15 family metallopeptidase [Cellulomonas sp.]MCR6647808.1 M15 family metallopeptidase [Cellulomonas sp.]